MEEDFFSTVTPYWRTTSGNVLVAVCTRLFTLIMAWSGSVPTLKETIRFISPLEAEVEFIYNISSTPFTCCSIGAATVSAMTSGLAPGYLADTCTVGGVRSGYCSIGSMVIDTIPNSTIKSDITVEKIGRLIKNLENIRPSYLPCWSFGKVCASGATDLSMVASKEATLRPSWLAGCAV